MAQNIILKRSATSGKVPTTSSLNIGELAINTYDGKIFLNRSGSSQTIQEIVTTNVTNTGSITLTQTGSFGELVVTKDTNLKRDVYVTRDIITNGSLDMLGNITGSSAVLRGNLTVSGSQTIVGNLTAASIVGSISASNGIVSGSSQIVSILSPLNSYSSSNDTKWTTIGLLTGSYANTGSNVFVGNQTFNNDITILGAVNARQFNIGVISSSIMYTSGSNKFGDTSDDTHQFTGSVIISGSQTVTGSLTVRVGTGETRFGAANGRTLSAYDSNILANFDFLAVQTYFNSDLLINDTKKISTNNGSSGSLYLTTATSSAGIKIDRNLGITGSLSVSGSSSFIGNISQNGNNVITGSLIIANSTNPAQKNTLTTDTNGYLSFQNVVYQGGIGSNGGNVNLFPNYITVGTGSGYVFSANGNSSAGTQDVGIRRNTIGSIEIFNGITWDGAVGNRRDLIARNITGSNASFSGSVSVTGSFLVNGTAVGVAPGPNTYDFNLDPNAAGTVNYIQDSTGNSFVIAKTGSIDVKINNSTFLSISQSAINVTTGSITANYMHLAKYINTAGDLDFNI